MPARETRRQRSSRCTALDHLHDGRDSSGSGGKYWRRAPGKWSSFLQRDEADQEALVFWLSNTLHLLARVREHGGSMLDLAGLVDLTRHVHDTLWKHIQNGLSPIIVNGFLEAPPPLLQEDASSARATLPSSRYRSSSSLQSVLHLLSGTHRLLERYCVPGTIREQIFSHASYFVNALLLNSLLLRKSLCDVSTAQIIQGNLSKLETWAVAHHLTDFMHNLMAVRSATHLLRISLEDVPTEKIPDLVQLCDSLNSFQVEKLLRASPQNVPSSVILRIIQECRRHKDDARNTQLFVDTFHSSPLQLDDFRLEAMDCVPIPSTISLPYVQK